MWSTDGRHRGGAHKFESNKEFGNNDWGGIIVLKPGARLKADWMGIPWCTKDHYRVIAEVDDANRFNKYKKPDTDCAYVKLMSMMVIGFISATITQVKISMAKLCRCPGVQIGRLRLRFFLTRTLMIPHVSSLICANQRRTGKRSLRNSVKGTVRTTTHFTRRREVRLVKH